MDTLNTLPQTKLGAVRRTLTLVERLSKEHQLDNRTARAVVDSFFEAITIALEERKRIEMRGFGVFEPRRREARIKRNPRTGEHVEKDVTHVAFFKTGQPLRERLNNKTERD